MCHVTLILTRLIWRDRVLVLKEVATGRGDPNSNLKTPAFSRKSVFPKNLDGRMNPLVNHLFCFDFIYKDKKINATFQA